jgi:hypothetical protein
MIDSILNPLRRDPTIVRGVALAALLLLLMFCALALAAALRRRYTLGTRTAARLYGVGLPLGSAGFAACLLLIGWTRPGFGPAAGLTPLGALEIAMPLIVSIQAALAYTPAEDPMLEILLTYPRPIGWVAADRLLFPLLTSLGIGLAGSVLVAMATGTALTTIVLRWLPGALLATGLAVRVAYSTREVVFGLVAGLIGGYGLRLASLSLLMQHPYTWPVLPYLSQYDVLLYLPKLLPTSDYALNRWLVSALGLALFISAFFTLRSPERLLGKSSRNGGE